MATEVSLADFRARFSALASKTDAEVQTAIDLAGTMAFNQLSWLYAAAHLVVRLGTESTTGAGVVSKESIGPRSVEFMLQAKDAGEAFWGSTRYGQIYNHLNRGRTLARVIKS